MQRTSSEGLRDMMDDLYKEDTEDRVRCSCRQRVAVLLMPNIPTEVQMAVGPKYSCKVQSLDGAWGLS